ncbi:hypothetical protein [Mucilaginibacter sp.]|uniref:hypothetical protein n=1 Tax=Mucilaginibacter sp. TaxID=1882438 RepID=UPI0035BC829C
MDDIIKFSHDGNKIAYIKEFYTNHGTLEIVDLKTMKRTTVKHAVKKLGDNFSDRFIQIVNDYNITGGLFFLNGRERSLAYYRELYPKLRPKDKRALGVDTLIIRYKGSVSSNHFSWIIPVLLTILTVAGPPVFSSSTFVISADGIMTSFFEKPNTWPCNENSS